MGYTPWILPVHSNPLSFSWRLSCNRCSSNRSSPLKFSWTFFSQRSLCLLISSVVSGPLFLSDLALRALCINRPIQAQTLSVRQRVDLAGKVSSMSVWPWATPRTSRITFASSWLSGVVFVSMSGGHCCRLGNHSGLYQCTSWKSILKGNEVKYQQAFQISWPGLCRWWAVTAIDPKNALLKTNLPV